MKKILSVGSIVLVLLSFFPTAYSQGSHRTPLEDHRVFLFGDSQVAGAFGRSMGYELVAKNITYFARAGQEGWGVGNWLQHQHEVRRLINNHQPTLLLIALGGNDFNRSERLDYQNEVQTLWNLVNERMGAIHENSGKTWKIIWIGPARAVGNSADMQEGRARAGNTIRGVVGEGSYVDSTDITNEEGRTGDGLHFTAEGGREWAKSAIERIENLLRR